MELEKREIIIGMPYALRFPIAWTIFFSLTGILTQSIQEGQFVFIDFFGKNYADWLMTLNPFLYASPEALIFSILGGWYYFFYTGGLVALIWKLLVILVNKELVVKRKGRY
jgi:hypothetical protein